MSKIKRLVENNYIFAAGLIFMAWFVMTNRASEMIGDLFPVVSKLHVETVELYTASDIPAVKITGYTEKYQECDFVDMKWFARDGSIEGSATSYFLDPPRGNETGIIRFAGIIVGITPERLSVARSYVTHRCWGGVKVITEFYEGEDL